MNDTELNRFFYNLRDEERITYRKYEKTYLKIINTTKAITFNNNCIREKLCPKCYLFYVSFLLPVGLAERFLILNPLWTFDYGMLTEALELLAVWAEDCVGR